MAMAGGTMKARDVDAEQEAHGKPLRGADPGALAERVLTANSVSVPASLLLHISVALRNLLGDGGTAVLYHLSREGAKAWCTGVKKDLRLDDGDPALVQLVEELAVRNNWGKMRFSRIDPVSATCDVSLQGCLECSHVRMSDGPVCHFIRGVVAGFASVLLGVEVHAVETGCKAQGEASCQFEVKRRV